MNLRVCAVGPVVLAGMMFGTAGFAQDPPRRPDQAADVRAVFAVRCAACHGPEVVRPKGRFGYVLDLRRIAANAELVVPSKPDESELWVLIREGEMPPPGSRQGPLTAAEKAAVKAWIAAGAPDAAPPAAEARGKQ